MAEQEWYVVLTRDDLEAELRDWWADLTPAELNLVQSFLDRQHGIGHVSAGDIEVDSLEEFAQLYGPEFQAFLRDAWQR